MKSAQELISRSGRPNFERVREEKGKMAPVVVGAMPAWKRKGVLEEIHKKHEQALRATRGGGV